MLLLLPAEGSKLFAKWQGPYKITKKISTVDYEIEMPEKMKKKGFYHVNLLKEWKERKGLWGEVEEEDFGPEMGEVLEGVGKITVSEGLREDQKRDVQILENEVQDVFSNIPGKTHLIQHHINTPAEVIVRDHGRTWSRHLIGVINKEVQEMLQLGIIEPSLILGEVIQW